MSRSVDWWYVLVVSRQHIGPNFNGQIGGPETPVTKHQSTLRNIQEERISYLHYSQNLKSRKT